jgi:hypothetical protein
LLPELFPLVANAFIDLNARKTLLELLCCDRQTHALCLPSLMKSRTGPLRKTSSRRFPGTHLAWASLLMSRAFM